MSNTYLTVPTISGRHYVVTTDTPCTIYSPDGIEVVQVNSNEQGDFVSHWTFVLCDYDEVEIRDFFNSSLRGKSASEGSSNDTSSSTYYERAMPYRSGELPSSLKSGYIYDLGIIDSELDLSNLSLAFVDFSVSAFELWFSTETFTPSIIWPLSSIWAEGRAPILLPFHQYRIKIRQDGVLRCCLSEYYPSVILPEGEMLEYIESTGSQYIDTGLTLDDPYYSLKACTKRVSDSYLFRIEGENNHRCVSSYFYSGSFMAQRVPVYNSNTITLSNSDAVIYYEEKVSDGKLVLTASSDNIDYSATNNIANSDADMDFLKTTNLCLFGYQSPTGLTKVKCRLYFIELVKSNGEMHKFHPYQLDSGEIGLVDLVTGKFYGNDGTGEFIAGPII